MTAISVAERVVDAPLELAFARFIDFSCWDQWMPRQLRPLAGPARALREGDAFTLGLPPRGKLAVQARVLRVRPNKEICWTGGIRHVLRSEHSFFFAGMSSGQTRIRSEEPWDGLFTLGPLEAHLEREATRIAEDMLSGFAEFAERSAVATVHAISQAAG